MKNLYFSSILTVAKSLVLALALYTICRILFLCFNFSYFSDLGVFDLLKIFWGGLRFDISALFIINSLFVALALIPFVNKGNEVYQKILKFIFICSNAVALLLNCIDFSYFKFTFKRSTAELFFIREDVGSLLGQYILDYWYIAVIWILLVYILYRLYPKITTGSKPEPAWWKKAGSEVLLFIFAALLLLLGIRGGFQLKPLRIITAAEYTEAKNIAGVINTPFSVIKSLSADYITAYQFYPDKELENLAPFIHKGFEGEMKKDNVVVILLESFSKEYVGFFNKGKGYTPFLDSLLPHSLYFENSFANGKRSIEGIPAVLAGIPSLMENPYITSVYATNQIAGLGTLLKRKGYTTSFFHGGTNGTMGFDAFSRLAGFDTYYGRTEYNNEAEYDGSWGIYDVPFFEYFAQQLTKQQQPFCAAFFTLSSHHPYAIPQKLAGKFPKGTLEIHQSIGYADYALRHFFKIAEQMPWFKNTLFVITADHTSLSESPYYQGKVGRYAVPILFYKANDSLKQVGTHTAQQIDILPTILEELNYNENYFAFGKSLLNTKDTHFAITYLNGVYQSITKQNSLLFDGEKVIGFYDLEKDSLMTRNTADSGNVSQKKQEANLKKIIQHFNYSLIENKMTAK